MSRPSAARKRKGSDAAAALDAMVRQAHARVRVQGLDDDLVAKGRRQVAGQGRQAVGQGQDKGRKAGPAGTQQNVQDSGARDIFLPRAEGVRSQLEAILADPTAPAATRGQAARTLAEMDGLIGRHQAAPDRAGDTPAGELSRSDLLAELARLRQIAGVGQG